MTVIPYDERYKEAFIRFNTDWIVRYFGGLEQADRETFEKIDEELENGAMIFFAVEDEIPLAVCMVRPEQEDSWEICKLGSDPDRPHKGCGSAVFEASVEWALEHGAKRIFLETNRKLKAAVHIYEKYGFI